MTFLQKSRVGAGIIAFGSIFVFFVWLFSLSTP